jgi:D-xylose transport system permease protein
VRNVQAPPPEGRVITSAGDPSSAGPGPLPRKGVLSSWIPSRRSDAGLLPIVIGLGVIWAVFQSQNSNFLSPENLTNLTLQIAATGSIAVGLFMVLLLGEIDLSVGIVSGLGGALLGVLAVNHDVNPVLAIGLTVVAGLIIGSFHGLIVVRVRVPSFVVTLAGLIAWQGVQLKLLGNGGSINFPDSVITRLTSTFLTPVTSAVLAAVVCGIYLAVLTRTRTKRLAAELPAMPLPAALARAAALFVLLEVAVFVLGRDRGVPLAFVIFVAIVFVVDLFVRNTPAGRYVLAIGGNSEAARRAGIPVDRVRMAVLAFASMMAVVGGIMSASRLLSVSASTGSDDTLLNAIAAVVIGGTSLFGGRGTAYSALLGMLVIGSISNGMDLLSLDSSVKFIITGIVLLLAVSFDAISRARR